MIPKPKEMVVPILDICKGSSGLRYKDLASKLADRFNLPEEERKRLQPSGHTTFLRTRTGWAVWMLKQAGFVRVDDKIITITDAGTDALSRSLSNEDVWKIAIERIDESKREDEPPEEEIKKAYDNIRQKAETELLDRIRKTSPESFDRLVIRLVRKMGYGIEDHAPAMPGGGVVDAVLKMDKIGFDEIHLQTKQQSATVSLDQVKIFTGTLMGTKSKRGALVTASDFSPDARRHVESVVDANIILIDGKMLAHYMYDHDLGVVNVATYSVKGIDEGFLQDE